MFGLDAHVKRLRPAQEEGPTAKESPVAASAVMPAMDSIGAYSGV